MIGDELLAAVATHLGTDVAFDAPPTKLGGGFYTANYRFSLRDAPPPWNTPLVLRLFPLHAPDGLAAWEAAVQGVAHGGGAPAPRVLLHEPGSTLAGRQWFVMELLPGAPMLAGLGARHLLGSLRRLMRDVPRQTAEAHLALHRVDAAPLLTAFGDDATVARFWSAIPATLDDGSPHPLRPGADWLAAHVPEPRNELVLCHGDSWGGNLLVRDGAVIGLIDWTLATIADPSLDVGFFSTALSMAPVPLWSPLQRGAQQFGKQIVRAYRACYESQSSADLTDVPYYEALRCLIELRGVVGYRVTVGRGDDYDSPRPGWDLIADRMVDYFEQRTGVRLDLPAPVTTS